MKTGIEEQFYCRTEKTAVIESDFYIHIIKSDLIGTNYQNSAVHHDNCRAVLDLASYRHRKPCVSELERIIKNMHEVHEYSGYFQYYQILSGLLNNGLAGYWETMKRITYWFYCCKESKEIIIKIQLSWSAFIKFRRSLASPKFMISVWKDIL